MTTTCPRRFIRETLKDPVDDLRQQCAKDAGHRGRHRNADGSLAWQEGAEVSLVAILAAAEERDQLGPQLATADDVVERRARYADTPGGHADRRTLRAVGEGPQ
ncbi:hypothetical protein [Nocardioides sp. ChNu-99]|uniref:hypothetical protein n=1 Tax=Nocardioides sp. ChNu-99 TaxID=2839897 RepID=UPI0024060B0C|nr:hypothetical protein [Nocardioides sp. ChNu-99]MDF9718098.1 hypothetical protein [Nocardioides sp. ChNu-99]